MKANQLIQRNVLDHIRNSVAGEHMAGEFDMRELFRRLDRGEVRTFGELEAAFRTVRSIGPSTDGIRQAAQRLNSETAKLKAELAKSPAQRRREEAESIAALGKLFQQ